MNPTNKTFNLNDISKYRNYLMGIATLLVTIKHSTIVFAWLNDFGKVASAIRVVLFYLKYLGHVGVDIFLFVSAIGLFYSLEKDNNTIKFYKRRLNRILPIVFIYLLISHLFIYQDGLIGIIKSISGYSLYTNGTRDCWYITYVLILYLIYPLLLKLEKKYGRKVYLYLIIIVIIRNYIYSIIDPFHFNNIEIALRRTPVFLLGCNFASDVKSGRTINSKLVLYLSLLICVISFVFTIIGYESNTSIWSHLDRYIGTLYALSLMILTIYLAKIIEQRKLFRIVEWLGIHSLEIFLIFDKVLLLDKYSISNQNISIITNIICFVFTCILSYLIKILFSKNINNKNSLKQE